MFTLGFCTLQCLIRLLPHTPKTPSINIIPQINNNLTCAAKNSRWWQYNLTYKVDWENLKKSKQKLAFSISFRPRKCINCIINFLTTTVLCFKIDINRKKQLTLSVFVLSNKGMRGVVIAVFVLQTPQHMSNNGHKKCFIYASDV